MCCVLKYCDIPKKVLITHHGSLVYSSIYRNSVFKPNLDSWLYKQETL